jgi:hypothetical protein
VLNKLYNFKKTVFVFRNTLLEESQGVSAKVKLIY